MPLLFPAKRRLRGAVLSAGLLLASPAFADDFWGSLAGGALGGAAGSFVGNWFQQHRQQQQQIYYPPPRYAPEAQPHQIDWCVRTFRSYNPELGIYYGFDGRPRRCP